MSKVSEKVERLACSVKYEGWSVDAAKLYRSVLDGVQALEHQLDEARGRERVSQATYDKQSEAYVKTLRELHQARMAGFEKGRDEVADLQTRLAELEVELSMRCTGAEYQAGIRQAKREAYIAALVLGPEEIRKRLDELNEEET